MSATIKVRKRKSSSKKKKPKIEKYYNNIFEYDPRDYDGFSDDPDDLIDE